MKNTKPASKRKVTWPRKAAKVRLPKKYIWKLLRQLADDLRPHLSSDEYALLDQIVIDQDFYAYTLLKDMWGLQESNTPTCNVSLDNLRARYCVASVFSKYEELGNESQKEEAALKVFFKAEILNRHFNMHGYKGLSSRTSMALNNAFMYARAWISKVIGQTLPGFEELTLRGRHGPGATTCTVGGNTHAYFKYAEYPYSCTRRALPYAVAAIQQDERWLGALEDEYRKDHKVDPTCILNQSVFWDRVMFPVEGNRITFVPKSYKTHRTIAIEPTMNLFLQLGVDGFIRKRLKRWGFNLDDQSKNQELARLGSIHGKYATIDLSMASDTLTTRLCRELLPDEWYHYLMDLRSPVGDLGGRKIAYEKISSMGNGYTFALESLIFASLVYGVSKELTGSFFREDNSVYGDDIIVPSQHAPFLVNVLNRAGFTVNTEKSFFQGPIRESCGSDWFEGKAIRPIFIKRRPRDLKELFADRNRLRRWFDTRLGYDDCGTLKLLDRWIPSKFKTFVGPLSDEEFDTYIHCKYPLSRYISGSYSFNRLVRQSRKLSRKRFMFTKLLARLTPNNTDEHSRTASFLDCVHIFTGDWGKLQKPSAHQPSRNWREQYYDGNGSGQFEVPASDSWYFAIQPSTVDFWSAAYSLAA
jgi:hypothetical protein